MKAFQNLGGIVGKRLFEFYHIIRTYKIQIIYFDLTYPMASSLRQAFRTKLLWINKKIGEIKLPIYGFVRVISIVETILDLFSPSRGGISTVPIDTFDTLRSFRKRLLAISAQSTAVVIACPRALRVISFWDPENAVMMAST